MNNYCCKVVYELNGVKHSHKDIDGPSMDGWLGEQYEKYGDSFKVINAVYIEVTNIMSEIYKPNK